MWTGLAVNGNSKRILLNQLLPIPNAFAFLIASLSLSGLIV